MVFRAVNQENKDAWMGDIIAEVNQLTGILAILFIIFYTFLLSNDYT